MRRALTAAILTGGIALAGCSAATQGQSLSSGQDKPQHKKVQQKPDPKPSPNGVFSGSCDYVLPDNIMKENYKLIGDIEARNTGNVGIKVKVTIGWKQMGYKPVTMTKKAKIKVGHEKTIRFHKPVEGDTIDKVQSYQLNNMDEQRCTYKGTIIDTFGKVK